MNHQYPIAPIYAPTYPPNHQQPALPPRPQSNAAPQQSLSADTLPPLSSATHPASAFANDSSPIRSLLGPSLRVSQPGSYPAYAPTANTFYPGHNPFSQQNQNQQLNRQSRPSSVAGSSQPVYTSAPTHPRLPNIQPMPPRGNGRSSLPSTPTNQLDGVEEPPPTHVVGSQGRRGILPSAAGRPQAVAGANTSGHKAAPTPEQDDQGKYPCAHCTKVYLHAKHLKRHLLRHTGERPYTCGLCKDTFSRSDILKRHFQKCADRRGNPSGESHLFHSRANKKSKLEDAARMESSASNGFSQAHEMEPLFPTTSLPACLDMSNLHLGRQQFLDGENEKQASRPNSVKESKRSTGSHSNRVSLGMVNTSGFDTASYGYVSGHVTPDSATTSGAATPFTYLHDSRSNQMSPSGAFSANGSDIGFGGPSRAPSSSNYSNGALPHIAGQRGGLDFDWHAFPPYNSSDEYSNIHYPSGTNTPSTAHRIKSEGDLSNLQMEEYSSYLQSKA